MRVFVHFLPLSCAWLLAGAADVSAATADGRADIWDIPIGTAVADIVGSYGDFACGTNGGPPSLPLSSFAEFTMCPVDEDGLAEVYFRYDAQAEFAALAHDRVREAARVSGTRVFEFPVVASFLIDAGGVVRGHRIVTDPRPENASVRLRHEFWTMGNLLRVQFGTENWNCEELLPTGEEHPAGNLFVNRRCSKAEGGTLLVLEQKFLQKQGQSFIDPHTGAIQPDAFDSETRFEMIASEAPADAQ